ncbi:MAG: glycosyltransferase family 2 protein [Christensenellaceae bacterium]
MLKLPLVSVIIPSYNYEKYIEQAILSVVNQTYQNLELVIVDDCSSDTSFLLIQKLAETYQNDMRFVLHQNKQNKGAYATINDGILMAHGEYITILNADDLYMPNRLEKMMDKLLLEQKEWAFSKVSCIDESGQPTNVQEFADIQKNVCHAKFMALCAVAQNVAVSTGNLLFSKKLYAQLNGFQNYQYVHDYDFFVRACLICEPTFAANTEYLYRLHGKNTFLSLAKEGLRENRMVWLDFYHNIQSRNIQNQFILQNQDYLKDFEQAVRAYGDKKLFLWKHAKNPLLRLGVWFLKSVHHIS